MSFLFGKKKEGKEAKSSASPVSRDLHSAQGSAPSPPQLNGARSKERSGGVSSPPPGLNSSIGSIEAANLPSQEQVHDQRTMDHELQHPPSRSMPMGPPNPAALYPWSQRRLTFTTSQPHPFPRYGAAVNAVSSKEGEVYLMGGLVNGSTVKGDLWMVEAGGSNLACYPIGTTFEGPGPRVGHASLLVGNAFIVFGGDTKMDESDKLDDTLYLLNTSTRHWSRAMPPGARPTGRYGHTLNISGSKIYIFGGQVEGYFFNDLIAFDLNALQNANSKWEMLIHNSTEGGPPEGQIPPARTNHTVVTWSDKLYLFGGTNGTTWFNDVWSYDPKPGVWTQLDCIGYIPAPREGHSAALVGDVMYIFGGRTEEGTDLGDLAAFRISSRRWYTFQNMGPSPSPRSGHSMTSFGKQIIVLAGEPSSTSRDPTELSLVYVLDTAKIRYPNDQQIQQTPAGERVHGNRRPSQERGAMQQPRGINAPNGAPEGLNRKYSASRESIAGAPRGPGPGPPGMGSAPAQGPGPGPGPGGRGPEMGINNGPPPAGRGSQIPRTSMAQNSSGPPPQQQAPPPRANGVVPTMNGPRSRTPTRDGRGYGPPIDTGARQGSLDNGNEPSPVVSPVGRDGQRSTSGTRAISPAVNGRRTPQQQQQAQQQPRFQNVDDEDTQFDPTLVRSRSRQAIQDSSSEEVRNNLYTKPGIQNRGDVLPSKTEPSIPLQQFQQIQNQHQGLQSQHEDLQNEHQDLRGLHEALQQEVETAKNRNAWYASELSLARKAGYQPSGSPNSALDDKSAPSFGDDEKPLIEALIAVRTELAEVRGSVAARENAAAQQVAEIEHQRDNAIREAAYARAKLAAHGGMPDASTPQSEAMSRELSGDERNGDMSKKLAASIVTQQELKSAIAAMANELQNEKRARELAESSAEAAQKSALEFEQSRNPGDIESLRMELHQLSRTAREEAAQKAEAHARSQMLEVDKNELMRKHEEAVESLQQHTATLASLREAVTASTDKSTLLERKLEEEKRLRSHVDQKLLQLRAEHEERTAELDDTTRKLRDAEEMVGTHAAEAKTHRIAVVAGLDKLNSRALNDKATTREDERIPILQRHVEEAQALVKKNQADADLAAEKLRSAEGRIAGLEAYQEQTSRENLSIRKQFQESLKESQTHQSKLAEVQREFESHQREANALSFKHAALKELLDERGISEGGKSRGIEAGGADNDRLRDLEQKLEAEIKAHNATRSNSENQTAETDKTYREKLELLENDYQSAVSYVKGTEKMLKRMKDELTKYKQKNDRLQSEIETVKKSSLERSIDSESAASWESERAVLSSQVASLQQQTQHLTLQLQQQTTQIQIDLATVKSERDHYRATHESTQAQLVRTTQEARAELEQLKSENSMLESRALDAEQKVTVLLDQVSASVGNYRRQSQSIHGNANGHGHSRNLSSMSETSAISGVSSNHPAPGAHHGAVAGADASSFPNVPDATSENNRNSLALDTLASELETLRSHWEDNHRTYRLSNQFDFERGGDKSTGKLNESLADWRKRLSAEGGVKGGLPRLSSDDEDGEGRKEERESAIVKPHDRMPGTISSDESDDEDRGKRGYVI